MKEIGIPYSAPMILAKLAGRKTKTRRVVVPQPCSQDATTLEGAYDWSHDTSTGRLVCLVAGDQCWEETQLKPPRGVYWQEAFDFGGVESACGRHVIALRYKADGREDYPILSPHDFALAREWKAVKGWRGMPAMFMLRSMSRGLDEVIGLRVERVQEITEEDATAEGCEAQVEKPYDWWEGYNTTFRDRYGNASHQMIAKEDCPEPPEGWEEVRTHKGSAGFNISAR